MAQSVKKDVVVIRERTLEIRNLTSELAKIKDLPRLKSMADKAEALQIWSKRAQMGWEMAAQAAEIRIRAARRGGIILSTMKKGYGRGGSSQYSKACEEAGMPQWQAALWQRVSDIPDEEFEDTMESNRAGKRPVSIRRLLSGQEDRPGRGCAVLIKFTTKETRKLDKARDDEPREDFVKRLVMEWLNA